MKDIQVGTVQSGTIFRQTENGYVLLVNDHHVLLPFEDNYQIKANETIDVFIYYNHRDELRATTCIPSVQIGMYGWAEVVKVLPNLGVFVDIGVDKDMLVSVDDLPAFKTVWPHEGDMLFVTLDVDYQGRLLAVLATEQIFYKRREIATEDLFNQSIAGRVYFTSREGTAIFSEEGYRGFIHHSERGKEPRLGESIKGRIIDVKDDGTVNVSLLPLKQDRITDDAQIILNSLRKNNGVIPYNDKSDPQNIQKTFGFSKSAFKRALGRLMREKKVEQRDGNTFLISND